MLQLNFRLSKISYTVHLILNYITFPTRLRWRRGLVVVVLWPLALRLIYG